MLEIEEKLERIEKKGKNDQANWWLLLGVVVLLTAVTRYYNVLEPDHVCWDETHFGKMGSWYINRTFFFDVHPPLGKMLIAFSGYLTGYDGKYPFEKPGDKYNGTHYEGMRLFCTTLGALIIPMAFDTIYDLTHSMDAAAISAANLIFDVGMLTLNRYILLDPILLFFMTASVWGMVKVTKFTSRNQSYTLHWWLWLMFTGTMLSCTISVKFVGLFVVLLVGLHTVNELWLILGDMEKPVLETVKQLLSRALTLILWPCLLYMLFFYIHLTILNRSGNGDGFYSSAFQSRLIGNSLYNASMPRQLAYGAVVTIKNHKTGGGYLHSHLHLYPIGMGARQQQITTYTHKDDNNKWIIKPFNKDSVKQIKFVKHGDLIRLQHVTTKRNLHSHTEPAPLTKKHLQVTGYGENGNGDANDVWRILIVGGKTNETIRTVTSRFILVHYLQSCLLTATGRQLPKWGFDQQEVACNLNLRDANGFWNVEDNKFRKLPNVNFSVYGPSFWERFLESHAVMFQGNAGLKPKEGEVTSRPWQWPVNYRGQYFSAHIHRVYLLGNPFIWWSNLLFLVIFLMVFLINAIKERRAAGRRAHLQSKEHKIEAIPQKVIEKVMKSEKLSTRGDSSCAGSSLSLKAATWLFIGWLIHYLPFWAMGRVLYFHHYFPALIFNSMLSGVMFHHLTGHLPRWLQHTLIGSWLSIMMYSFKLFSPLSYGMNGPTANDPDSIMYGLKWLPTWEF